MLTSFRQVQNRSFHVVERTRTCAKYEKNEECPSKAWKSIVFRRQICKFVTFSLPSSSWLLKFPHKQLRRQQQPNENVTKHLGNSDYLVIIASSSNSLLLTEHAANGLIEAPLK